MLGATAHISCAKRARPDLWGRVRLGDLKAGLLAAKALAKQDKTNSDWQRDLSGSYNKVSYLLHDR